MRVRVRMRMRIRMGVGVSVCRMDDIDGRLTHLLQDSKASLFVQGQCDHERKRRVERSETKRQTLRD